jgi:hypothetical protein
MQYIVLYLKKPFNFFILELEITSVQDIQRNIFHNGRETLCVLT